MADSTPDLWDTCYEGEHRKLLSPEQFRQMFCDVCMNVGCQNSRGFGTKWNHRIRTQEDRLLVNPQFAPPGTAELMGLPDFQSMLRDTLAAKISTRKNDWEPVTDEEVAREAARMMGLDVPAPSGFQEPEPEDPDPEPEEAEPEPGDGEEPPALEVPSVELSAWRVQGDTENPDTGSPVEYDVTLVTCPDGTEDWSCTCPARERPCKHIRYVQSRLAPTEPAEPAPDPVRPPPSPRGPLPTGMNTPSPQGGIMVGGGPPPASDPAPAEPVDPWAPPKAKKDRVIEVGGRVSFGSSKDKK